MGNSGVSTQGAVEHKYSNHKNDQPDNKTLQQTQQGPKLHLEMN